MNNRAGATFFGMVTLAGLLAAGPARADRVSVGVGVSGGNGNYFTFGMNSGGHGHGGPSHHGEGYGRGCGGYVARPPCGPAVVYAPRPVVYASPVYYVPPPVVVPSGYWQEREERTWVEGCWVETFDAYGRRCKMWQPGRWEVRRIREWVQ